VRPAGRGPWPGPAIGGRAVGPGGGAGALEDRPDRTVTLFFMKKSVLTRYRVMAYVTAVMLLVLCVSMIFKYGFDTGADVTLVVAQIHGVLFIVYLVFAFDLGQKARWPFLKLLWVLIAGTIPTAAFFVERAVVREIGPLVEEQPAAPAEV
jgi:integral membrane protein